MKSYDEVKGLVKRKGDAYCLAPERFIAMQVKRLLAHELVKTEMLGYCNVKGVYWIVCRESAGKYFRAPFARNKMWFDALTSEPEFCGIKNLPQIFITGVA